MSDTLLSLRRFDDYWGEVAGNLGGLEFVTLKSEPLRLESLRSGRVDLIFASPRQLQTLLDPNDPNRLQARFANELELSMFPTFNSHFIGFNNKIMDRNTRRLLASAIDRESLLAGVLPGSAFSNDLPIPRVMMEEFPPIKTSGPEQAESAHPIEILVHDRESAPEYVEAATVGWRRLGYEPRIRTMSLPALIDRVVRGDFEAAAMWYEYPFSSPAIILLEFYAANRQPMPNFFRYESAEFEAFLENHGNLTFTPTGGLDSDSAAELAKILRENPPAAFLFERSIAIVYRRGIEGVSMDLHSIPKFTNVIVP